MRAVAVIPARMGSTRLPGKVMADVHGQPLVVHVLERVMRATSIEEAYVATDSVEVADAVKAVGGHVIMTSGDFACGTERVAAAIRGIDAEVVINVQADNGAIEPAVIDAVVGAFDQPGVNVVTPVASFPSDCDPSEPSIVKAVVDGSGRAIYFSRSLIPHGGPWLHHIGVYGFRRSALQEFASWGAGVLEQSERLEQLRFLENGMQIHTVLVGSGVVSVDTPDDLDRLLSFSSGPSSKNSRL